MGTFLQFDDIVVEVVRKNVKHIRLTISRATGDVRIAAPHTIPLDALRELAATKLHWLQGRRAMLQRERAQQTLNQGERRFLVWGDPYPLECVEHNVIRKVELTATALRLYAPRGTTTERREEIIERWYRDQVAEALPPLIAKWEAIMQVRVRRLDLRFMTTRWGTCNAATATIRINTQLAKQPRHLLEYIVVHEMTHLFHQNHGAGFQAAMDGYLPDWRRSRQQLNGHGR